MSLGSEDWPIMPVEYAGFTLLPVDFSIKTRSGRAATFKSVS